MLFKKTCCVRKKYLLTKSHIKEEQFNKTAMCCLMALCEVHRFAGVCSFYKLNIFLRLSFRGWYSLFHTSNYREHFCNLNGIVLPKMKIIP